MKFNFTSEYPNKSPIVPFQTKLPPKSCENTLQLNALLAVLLKVDSLMSLINGTVCVLESEQLEPVKPILESPVISINKANPVMNHSHWIKTESGSGITPKMLDTHLQNLRVVRNIIHFHLDQKTMYQHKELLVIVFNFHNSCLHTFNDIPNTFKPFLSLDEFLNGIPCQVAKPYTDLPISQLPTRTHLACLAMLHTTAIRNGISESYSFQYLEPGVSYSSHDILLLTIRALGYIHSLKGSAIPIQHSIQVTITSISALFISRKVLEGLSMEPINIPYRQEAIHIIRNIIYNDVQQNSWQYPMISNVSCEFRKLLGINFSGTESMTDTYVTFNQPHIQQPQPYMNFHWNILQSSAIQDV
ncbi:hypothetical protein BC833DRAFT_600057 [Globomyces pollinis-pini]|nr:hypothetical protein BC833DRAFT_600057 [Globomyces pollinis-pini]